MKTNQEKEEVLHQLFKSTKLCETLFLKSHIGYAITQRGSGKFIDITEAKVTEAELVRSLNLMKKQLPVTISETERMIARLVAAGMSSKEIADQINLAPRTIDNHRSNIRKKLNVCNTYALRDTLQSYHV